MYQKRGTKRIMAGDLPGCYLRRYVEPEEITSFIRETAEQEEVTVIARESKELLRLEKLKETVGRDIEHIWLSHLKRDEALNPEDLTGICDFVLDRCAKGRYVIISGVEYLISRNGFNPVFRLLTHIHDCCQVEGRSVIIYVSVNVMKDIELHALEREFTYI